MAAFGYSTNTTTNHKPLTASEKFLAKITEDTPGYINWADAVSIYANYVDKIAVICTTLNIRSEEFWEAFRKEIYAIASVSHALHLEYAHEAGSGFMDDNEDDDHNYCTICDDIADEEINYTWYCDYHANQYWEEEKEKEEEDDRLTEDNPLR